MTREEATNLVKAILKICAECGQLKNRIARLATEAHCAGHTEAREMLIEIGAHFGATAEMLLLVAEGVIDSLERGGSPEPLACDLICRGWWSDN